MSGNYHRSTTPEFAQRRATMISEYLMKDATLDKVGKSYGLTRERVRQIITNWTMGIHDTKLLKKLLHANAFKCAACGQPLTKPYRKIYCNRHCFSVANRFDLKTILRCQLCGSKYYPYRNHAYTKGTRNFCCMDHYLRYCELYGDARRQGRFFALSRTK